MYSALSIVGKELYKTSLIIISNLSKMGTWEDNVGIGMCRISSPVLSLRAATSDCCVAVLKVSATESLMSLWQAQWPGDKIVQSEEHMRGCRL